MRASDVPVRPARWSVPLASGYPGHVSAGVVNTPRAAEVIEMPVRGRRALAAVSGGHRPDRLLSVGLRGFAQAALNPARMLGI